jgi:hypothetical protein
VALHGVFLSKLNVLFIAGYFAREMSNIPQSVLVTGANRGIGLGLVREFAKLPEVKLIFATTRNKANSQVDSQSMIGAVYPRSEVKCA